MAKMYVNGLLGLPARRKAAGYTQERLAAALGVARSALAMWEVGASWPSASLLPKMSDLLLCSIDELYQAPEDASCNAAPDAEIVPLHPDFTPEEAR